MKFFLEMQLYFNLVITNCTHLKILLYFNVYTYLNNLLIT